jgi:hypothetical protein
MSHMIIPGMPPGHVVAAHPQIKPIELNLADGGRVCFSPDMIKVIEDAPEYFGAGDEPRKCTRIYLATFAQKSWLVDVPYDDFLRIADIEPARIEEEELERGPGSE